MGNSCCFTRQSSVDVETPIEPPQLLLTTGAKLFFGEPLTKFQSEPNCSESLEPFWQSVAETIAWCQTRVDLKSPRDCLRSLPFYGQVPGPALEYHCLKYVGGLVRARRQELIPVRPESTRNLAGGRLIVHFPQANLADGAAARESDGFLDEQNVPPCDTWVGYLSALGGQDPYYSEYLIAWVPPTFVALAAGGIMVNPEQCIAWLDESGVALAHLLRYDG